MAKGKTIKEVTREYTINLHKNAHRRTFKKKAPHAIKVIKKFAQKQMGTEKVKIDAGLNKAVWAKGVRNIPRRIRVRISRQLSEDDEESTVTFVIHAMKRTYKFRQLRECWFPKNIFPDGDTDLAKET